MLASTLTALLALACTAAAHPDSAQVAASVRALGSAFEPYADRFADNGVDGAILVEYSPAGTAGSITDLLSELDIQKPLHRQVLAKHLQNLVHAVNETAPTTRRRLDRSTTAVADAASLTRNETELKEALMSGYDSNTQPADLLVHVQVAMLVFPEIDTTAQTVKMVDEQQPAAGSIEDLDRRLQSCLDAPHDAPADSAGPKGEEDEQVADPAATGIYSKEHSDVLAALGFRELGDPTELVARNTGALIDFVMSCILPLAYTISIVWELMLI